MRTNPLATLSSLLLAVPAFGQAIALTNAGFESPVLADNGYVFGVPSWTTFGTAGVYNPAASAFPAEAPEGSNVAFLSCCFGPNPNSGSISQTLATNYAADKTYTLSVQSGRRLDDPGVLRAYRFIAALGNTTLASKVFNTTMPTLGTFRTDTMSWNVFADDAAVGHPITFRLQHVSGNGQLLVDDVQLSAAVLCVAVRTQPADAQACPSDPSDMSVTVGGVGPFTYTWQYEDPAATWNNLTSGGAGPSGASTVSFVSSNSNKTSTLRINAFHTGDDKNYRCVITTGCGDTATSDAANFAFCAVDYACDGFIDFNDYFDFVVAYQRGLSSADFNGDSIIDFFDYSDFLDAFVEGC